MVFICFLGIFSFGLINYYSHRKNQALARVLLFVSSLGILLGLFLCYFVSNIVEVETTYTLSELKITDDEDSPKFFATHNNDKYFFIFYDEENEKYVQAWTTKNHYNELDSCAPTVRVTHKVLYHNLFWSIVLLPYEETSITYDIFVPKGMILEVK